MSRITRSNFSCAAAATASSPRGVTSTAWPSASRMRCSPDASGASSSTMSRRMAGWKGSGVNDTAALGYFSPRGGPNDHQGIHESQWEACFRGGRGAYVTRVLYPREPEADRHPRGLRYRPVRRLHRAHERPRDQEDRKSTRLNSSHLGISYAVFC